MSTLPREQPAERPLIGRAHEKEQLAQLLGSARDGAKRAALVLGTAGVGKSTLLRWTRARATDGAFLRGWVRAPAAAGLPPRFPIGELLEGLIADCRARGAEPPEPLRRVVDTLRGTTSAETYPAALPQIADALEATAGRAPVALFIDDCHWAPVEGMRLLLAAVRAVEVPLLLVVVARGSIGEGGEVLSLLDPAADLWVDQVELRGLGAEEVARLAERELAGPLLPSLARAVTELTVGNPLLLVETLRSWRDEGALRSIGGYWTIPEEIAWRSGRSLHDVIRTRLARLDVAQFSAAGALAVFGRDALFDEIRLTAGLDAEHLIKVLTDLCAREIVVDDGGHPPRYRLAHPLHESTLTALMGQTKAAAVHQRIFETLPSAREGRRAVTAAERAHHGVNSLRPPKNLWTLLRAAAEEAEAAGSYEEAAVWYEHLVREVKHDPRLHLAALEGQARAATNFDPRHAIDLLTEALGAAAEPHVRARLLQRRAMAARVAGSFDAALVDLTEALPIAASEDRFAIRHTTAMIHALQHRVGEAEFILQDLKVEYPLLLYQVIGHLGSMAWGRSRILEAREKWGQALSLCPDEHYRTFLLHNYTWAQIVLGEWSEAEPVILRTIDATARAGDAWNLVALLSSAGRLLAWKGAFAQALDFASRAVQLAPRLSNPTCRVDALDALGVALLEQGSSAEAAKALGEAVALVRPETEARELSFTCAMLAEALALEHHLELSKEALNTAYSHLDDAAFWEPTVVRADAQLALVSGNPSMAVEILEPWGEKSALLPFEHARLLETLAQASYSIGHRQLALDRMSEAARTYRSLGANHRTGLAEDWLALRRRGRPRSKLAAGLTAREVEVIRVLSLGRSNREIAEALTLSEGTVRKHLENISTKVCASNRTQIVTLARRLGVLDLEP